MIPARRVLAVCLLLWLAGPPLAAQPPAATQPFLGVTLTDVPVTLPRRARMLVAQVDLAAPGIRIAVSPPSGSREAVRETTLDFLTRTGAQLAVNAHFFLPFPSEDRDAWLIGLAAADGRVYSAFETPDQNFAIVADAPALRFDRRQRARIVHRRPGPDPRRVRERGEIWQAVAGSAQILTRGVVTIPTYRSATNPRGALVPGPDGRYDAGRSWYDLVTSRTIAGLSKNRRTLTLAVVDGEPGVAGLTPAEIATRLARDFAVWEAINLDGGGSTTMAWRDPATGQPALLNTPTGGAGGRAVASSLAVFARPAPTRPARRP